MDVFLWSVLYINSKHKMRLFKDMLESSDSHRISYFLILIVFNKEYENNEIFKKEIIEELFKIKTEFAHRGKNLYIIQPRPNIAIDIREKDFYVPNYEFNLFDYYGLIYSYLLTPIKTVSGDMLQIDEKTPIIFMRDVDLIISLDILNYQQRDIDDYDSLNMIIRGKQYISNIEDKTKNFNQIELFKMYPGINKEKTSKINEELSETIDLSGFVVPFILIHMYYMQRRDYFSKYIEYPKIIKNSLKIFEKVKFIDFIEEYGIFKGSIFHTPGLPFIFHRLGYKYDI